MGWDNPPVPWQEFERRLSWRASSSRDNSARSDPRSDGDTRDTRDSGDSGDSGDS